MAEITAIIDDFNHKAGTKSDTEAIGSVFSATIKKLGFDGYDAWCLREGTINNIHQAGNFFVHDYDLNVVVEYILSGFLHLDPMMIEIGKTSRTYDFVEFLKKGRQNSSAKWQLRMLKLFNVSHGWLVPLNIVDANRGVTCYIKGNTPQIVEHFENSRAQIQLISAEFMQHLVRVNMPASSNSANDQKNPELTARELDCLHWAARGKTNGEIADILAISQNTVRYHLKNIYSKLDVTSRSNAVLMGLQSGIIN